MTDLETTLARIEGKLDKLLAGDDPSPEDDPVDLRPGWMTIPQAARFTEVSRYTLRQACNLGRIEDCYKNANGRWRISEEVAKKIRAEGLPKPVSSR